MRLRIRAVEIDIVTDAGPFGTRVDFKPGFNVLNLPNSKGKSTCLQAIMYALGLETVYGGYRTGAFQNVLTSSLEDENGREHAVRRSDILLEFENGRGDVATVRRSVKGVRDTRLVTLWQAAAITDGLAAHEKPQGYYLGYPGAAQQERGYHAFLARFLGFDLPVVPKYEGDEVPLYLETFFPLFYVEQKRGWAALQLLTPTFYKIKDVHRRAIEYVLGLHVSEVVSKKLKLAERRNEIGNQWRAEVRQCKSLAARVNGQLRQLEDNLSEQGNDVPAVDAIVFAEGRWRNLDSYVEQLALQIDKASDEDAIELDETTRSTMTQIDDELAQLRMNARAAYDRLLLERSEVVSLQDRITSLRDDRVRAVDTRRIRGLEKASADAPLSVTSCPTCNQLVLDTLSPETIHGEVMSLDEHVEFIDGQVQAFTDLLPVSQQAVQLKEEELKSIRNAILSREKHLTELREQVRGKTSPMLEHYRQRARIEASYAQYRDVLEELREHVAALVEMFDEARRIRQELHDQPADDLSFEDLKRLDDFAKRLVHYLTEFQFESVKLAQVQMARDRYRPEFLGVDLDAQISGSDHIRLIWAYLIALLEISTDDAVSNHAGLLILDEPRQQEVSEDSFQRLCSAAAAAGTRNQQVIFGSAMEDVAAVLRGAGNRVNVISREGRLITKRAAGSSLIT